MQCKSNRKEYEDRWKEGDGAEGRDIDETTVDKVKKRNMRNYGKQQSDRLMEEIKTRIEPEGAGDTRESRNYTVMLHCAKHLSKQNSERWKVCVFEMVSKCAQSNNTSEKKE